MDRRRITVDNANAWADGLEDETLDRLDRAAQLNRSAAELFAQARRRTQRPRDRQGAPTARALDDPA